MTSNNVNNLLGSAQDDGAVTEEALQAINVTDLNTQIEAGLGIDVDDVMASEVVLVTQVLDDSSSIRFAGNTQIVCDGHNLVLESMEGSKQGDGILIHATTLNSGVLYPFEPLNQNVRVSPGQYNPSGSTPLYDRAATVLATVIAKAQEFENNGVAVRTVSLLVSDGGDNASRITAADIKKVVDDMHRSESHIIAGMGIDDGYTDFKQVFSEMGIPDEWILTPGNTESEIRKAFNVFSQSAVRASQSAANFSQAKIGGFAD